MKNKSKKQVVCERHNRTHSADEACVFCRSYGPHKGSSTPQGSFAKSSPTALDWLARALMY